MRLRPGRIPHSRPSISRGDAAAVLRVLNSRMLAQDREVRALELAMAERLGLRHAVASSSGTTALHLALLALGVRPRDRVLTPSYVCVAVLHAIRHAGGRERLVDCAPSGYNLDSLAAAPLARGCRAAVIPHLFGELADLRPLQHAGLPLVEDCAMALGATQPDGRPAGSLSAVSVHSFYATKTIAGGEGGLLATDDEALAREARDLRAYDKRETFRVRYNYKLTELQAALIRSQLRRLDRILRRRRSLAAYFLERIHNPNLLLPRPIEGSTFSRFVLATRQDFGRVQAHFRAHGIEVARPVHLPLHRALALDSRRFPRAEDRFLTAFSIPIYADLSAAEARRIVSAANQLEPLRTGDP